MLYFQAMIRFLIDLYSPVSLTIIEKYPHPEMLQKKKINTVSKVIQSKTCHRQAASDTMADKAIEYSKNHLFKE